MAHIQLTETMELSDARNYFANRRDHPLDHTAKVPDLKLTPIDPHRKQWMRDQFWATNYCGPIRVSRYLKQLRKRLLSITGEQAVMPLSDPDLDNLLAYGQLWIPNASCTESVYGLVSNCHGNSAEYFIANAMREPTEQDVLGLATGYALSDDSVWRCHSWLVRRQPRCIHILETTEPRLLYYGVILTKDALMHFLDTNV